MIAGTGPTAADDAGRLPGDPALANLVLRARRDLRLVDPLGALLLGDRVGGLSDAGAEADAVDRERLTSLLRAAEEIGAVAAVDDEVDRLSLVYGLRRAMPAAGPRAPAGVVLLERHLLARLPGLAGDPAAGATGLARLLEDGPGFLAGARQGCLGGLAPAGEVALAAAKRLPALLDVVATAAGEIAIEVPLRQRLEAGLGTLLAAAAEDGGWILKEYMPAAMPVAGRPDIAAGAAELGLGASLYEIEGTAEGLLAEQAALAFEAPPGAAGAAPAASGPSWDAVAVAARWEVVGADLAAWCTPPPGLRCEVEAAPAWLQSLLPPLALVNPGPLSREPYRLLVGASLRGPEADIDAALRAVYLLELLPVAWQRAGTRLARLLLAAPDAVSAWQAVARATEPGLRADPPVDLRRELAWRSILALIGAGFVRGRIDLAEGAALVAAETGMDAETARLQAAHVAAQPLAALAFIAGKRALDRIVPGADADVDPPAARARLLSAGPLPGGLMEMASGYTR
jgi:hypothetical protein